MADTVNTHWIYPPNYEDNPIDPGQRIPGNYRFKVRYTCESDGTGETDVHKLDISQLRTPTGDICTKVIVDKVRYNVSGLNVLIEWDRAANKEICRILGSGGAVSGCIEGPINDPSDAIDDRTGDIMITTTQATSGDGYDITIEGRTGS